MPDEKAKSSQDMVEDRENAHERIHQERPKKSGNDKDEGENKDKKDDKQQKPLPRWPFFVAGLVVLAFAGIVLYIVFAPRPDVWTDDAYVAVHYAVVAPRISGQVATVQVNDNQIVKAGQVLLTLDPRDYEVSVAVAQATLDRDQAQIGNAAANVSRQPALISQQEATLESAKARLGFSQADQKRYAALAATGAGSEQQRQQTNSQLQQDQASLQGAQAALEAARKQTDVLEKQKSAAESTVKGDQAQLEQAKLNLSYTRILAPLDGMVGQRTVQLGDIVSPGGQQMMVVPLDRVYIQASYREVDLNHVRSGQHVTIHVDAYNIDLDGIVDSVPPATGSTFAPIPANNATGNFTKIVQRLPVKIVLSDNQPSAKLLRVGLSVETTIHTGLENVVRDQENSPNRITVH